MKSKIFLLITLISIIILLQPINFISAKNNDIELSQVNNTSYFNNKQYGKGYKYYIQGWIYLHIEGDPYDRGYQHGFLLSEEIVDHIQTRKHHKHWDEKHLRRHGQQADKQPKYDLLTRQLQLCHSITTHARENCRHTNAGYCHYNGIDKLSRYTSIHQSFHIHEKIGKVCWCREHRSIIRFKRF